MSYKQLLWSHAKNEWRKATFENFGMASGSKKKKGEILKFEGAGSNNWNEREGN